MKDHKDLAKWQLISLVSRGIAMAIGIFQSFFIIQILSKAEWGIVQIAASLGAVFGIYQHFGLASGSTREISGAKDDTEVFKVFFTACIIRYVITFPVALFLFFAAENLAVSKYSEPSLVLPIKIYAITLLVQGVQSIFNSVISGTQRFKHLFIYQAVIAVVSVVLYIPFVYFYKINGYFYALLLFNIVSSISLGILALKPLKGKFVLPTKKDYRILGKELLSISLAIYFVKIIYTMWERIGPLLLGLSISKEMVGTFAFALLYAKKLVSISDAVTDVNLPAFSERYVKDVEHFKVLFRENFNKIFSFIVFSASSAVFWAQQIIRFAVNGTKYDDSFPLVLPMVFAFVFYSFVNLVKSSVVIPAKLIKEMIAGFASMLLITVFIYYMYAHVLGSLLAMAYAMFGGAIVGFLIISLLSQHKLKFGFLNHDHILILIQALVISFASNIENIFIKSGVYIVFLVLFTWAVFIAHFITKGDFAIIFQKLKLQRLPKI